MTCLATTLGRAVCVSLAVGVASALGACPGPHEIDDMVAAGLTARAIRAIFEETGWPACLSDEDLQRLRRSGLGEDLVAFLERRTAEPSEGAEYATANPRSEYTEPPPVPYPYPYDYSPYGYAYPYASGGVFVGGGFHHHHHDHVVAHDWLSSHDAGHVGLGGVARPYVHGFAPSPGEGGVHSDSHHGGMHIGHGSHGVHGGFGGHGGHGGH